MSTSICAHGQWARTPRETRQEGDTTCNSSRRVASLPTHVKHIACAKQVALDLDEANSGHAFHASMCKTHVQNWCARLLCAVHVHVAAWKA